MFTGDATAFSEAVAGTGQDFACAYPWCAFRQQVFVASRLLLAARVSQLFWGVLPVS